MYFHGERLHRHNHKGRSHWCAGALGIHDENDIEFARGIVNYNSDDCKRIIGNHSNEILKVLGFKNYDAIITRDNITIL